MKILVLGAGGYIGKHLCEIFESELHEVIPVPRSLLDFDDLDSLEKLTGLLSKEKPQIVINAIGSIDGRIAGGPAQLFNATLLPTYSLFRHYSGAGRFDSTTVILLGSTSAGQPRKEYPLYAALKSAEVALSKSAFELFSGTTITWKVMTVPRLNGGLGLESKVSPSNLGIADIRLENLTDSIREEISKLEM